MISMFITSLWTSDRALTFHAVRRRTRDGSPYQDNIIACFSRFVNTFSKNCIRRLIKIHDVWGKKYATIHKREGNQPLFGIPCRGLGPEGLWRCKLEKKGCASAKCTTRASTFPVRFVKLFFEKRLTIRMACGIIIKSSGRDPVRHLGVAQLVARYLGVVEAASSSLVTQTKNRES